MNAHAQWRFEMARDLGDRLERYSGIQAMLVGGSVARGYADAYSDIELLLFWDHAPDPELRRTIRRDLHAELRYPAFDPGHGSALIIGGVPVDLWNLTVAGQEADNDAVLHDYSIDLVASNRLDTVRTGIPLHGADLIHEWQRRVEGYPDELAVRMLQAYLPHFHLRQLNLAARRDNPTAYYHTLTDIQCSLFLVLLALNKSYFPTFKWIYQRLAELPIGPREVASRLLQMFAEPPLRAAAQLRDALAETLAIVEAQYPQLDTAYPRFGLDQTPPAPEPPTSR